MSKFRERDKIKAIGAVDGQDLTGRTGIVIHLHNSYPCNVGIQFDKEIPGGHDCQGRGKSNSCRYGYENELELITTEWDMEENEH